jgi:putative FmdB family regulatory protein
MFEYKCGSCGTVSEFLVGVSQDREQILCGDCGSHHMMKVFSPMSFSVKTEAQGCACGMQRGETCEAAGCPNAV